MPRETESSLTSRRVIWNAACAQWPYQANMPLAQLVEIVVEARLKLVELTPDPAFDPPAGRLAE